jgi:snapalysin
LPDNYNGDCSILMSGHSAGTACTNAKPGASEVAQVDQIFAGNTSAARVRRSTVGVF